MTAKLCLWRNSREVMPLASSHLERSGSSSAAASLLELAVLLVALAVVAYVGQWEWGWGRSRTYPNGVRMESVATAPDGTRYGTFNCPKCGKPSGASQGKWGMDHDLYYEPSLSTFALHQKCWAESTVAERVALLRMFMATADYPADKSNLIVKATLEGK